MQGRCGSACGFETHTKEKYCDFGGPGDTTYIGTIPQQYLISARSSKHAGKHIVFSEQYRNDNIFGDVLHTFFMLFMTITVISMWISFLPGVGTEAEGSVFFF